MCIYNLVHGTKKLFFVFTFVAYPYIILFDCVCLYGITYRMRSLSFDGSQNKVGEFIIGAVLTQGGTQPHIVKIDNRIL